jgi:hypothetical protein
MLLGSLDFLLLKWHFLSIISSFRGTQLLQALYITVVGMLIVFAALGAVLLVMIGLNRLFREKGNGEQEE